MDTRRGCDPHSASRENRCSEMDHDLGISSVENWKVMSREMAQPPEPQDQKNGLEQRGRMDPIHDASAAREQVG
jgi:hypothetical protein